MIPAASITEWSQQCPWIPPPAQEEQSLVLSRALVEIYSTTELLGTIVRALYQRRKDRDLFDLWCAHPAGMFKAPAVAGIFARYMEAENH